MLSRGQQRHEWPHRARHHPREGKRTRCVSTHDHNLDVPCTTKCRRAGAQRAFRDFGLPAAIRTDNGVPFASPTALYQLSKLAVWWLRLGIRIERIDPGQPQQNGRHERMHLTLDMQVPAARYIRSSRVYRGLGDLTYPFHDTTITVTHCGRLCFKGRKINLSQVFAGQNVGVTQVGEHLWLVTFMQYDLGYFDDETCRLEPIDNPFGPKVLPMCSE